MVMGSRAMAWGFLEAWARSTTAMAPRSSDVDPYTCWWRRHHMANHCGGTMYPWGPANWPSPPTLTRPVALP
jgi:hypothetical protein